jgi:hypothetical protein
MHRDTPEENPNRFIFASPLWFPLQGTKSICVFANCFRLDGLDCLFFLLQTNFFILVDFRINLNRSRTLDEIQQDRMQMALCRIIEESQFDQAQARNTQ